MLGLPSSAVSSKVSKEYQKSSLRCITSSKEFMMFSVKFENTTYLRILSWMGSVFEMGNSADAEPCWDMSVEEIYLNGRSS